MHFAVFACIKVRRAHFGAQHVMHPLCIAHERGETSGSLRLHPSRCAAMVSALLLTALCMHHESRHRRAIVAKWRKSPGTRAGHCAGAAERDPGVRLLSKSLFKVRPPEGGIISPFA